MEKLLSHILIVAIFVSFITSCWKKEENKHTERTNNTLIIFHAGSLSLPLLEMKKEFEKRNPGTNIILEAAGSLMCARKVMDLHKPCDVLMSADYAVINKILIPDYASWCINFASTSMAIVYTDKSKYHNEINSSNWFRILQRSDVRCAASNPNDDPCGYRAILMLKLASLYYNIPSLCENIIYKKTNPLIVRSKETDMVPLLQTGEVDYIFLYSSVAQQHGFKCLELPPQINLNSEQYADSYGTVNVEINGSKPGTKETVYGSPMLYGLTILKNAPNPKLAERFVEFVLSKDGGVKILQKLGQSPSVPSATSTFDKVPERLKAYALPPGK